MDPRFEDPRNRVEIRPEPPQRLADALTVRLRRVGPWLAIPAVLVGVLQLADLHRQPKILEGRHLFSRSYVPLPVLRDIYVKVGSKVTANPVSRAFAEQAHRGDTIRIARSPAFGLPGEILLVRNGTVIAREAKPQAAVAWFGGLLCFLPALFWIRRFSPQSLKVVVGLTVLACLEILSGVHAMMQTVEGL